MEDKISLDDLQEEIAEFEDYVQSTDVAGMSLPLEDTPHKLTSFSYAKALEERSRFFLYGIRRRMHYCHNATFGISFQAETAYEPSFHVESRLVDSDGRRHLHSLPSCGF
jgi:hypothetical protein